MNYKSEQKILGKKERYSRVQFFWFYGEADVFDDKEIVGVSSVSYASYATTVEQAKGELREKIRSLGGNAAMFFSLARGTTARTLDGEYSPACYRARAQAALVVPKEMNPEKRQELQSRFMQAVQSDEEEEKTSVWGGIFRCLAAMSGAAFVFYFM